MEWFLYAFDNAKTGHRVIRYQRLVVKSSDDLNDAAAMLHEITGANEIIAITNSYELYSSYRYMAKHPTYQYFIEFHDFVTRHGIAV